MIKLTTLNHQVGCESCNTPTHGGIELKHGKKLRIVYICDECLETLKFLIICEKPGF